jgi:TRAP-type C4-dicarboxylate transport system substrate-binding protein
MRSRKAWVPENNELALVALQAFSISPIPLPLRDVLMGLQTNMIDIVAGSPVAALALQWHTKVKYVTDLPLSYIFGALVIDHKVFKKISAPDQIIVKSVMGEIIKTLDKKNRQDNLLGKEAMIKQGIQFIKPTQAAADELREKIVFANEKLEKDGNLTPETVDRMNKFLADYRRLNP